MLAWRKAVLSTQLTYPDIKMFPLDCCVYDTASHLSIACAVPLPLINGILLLLENLSADTSKVFGTQSTYTKQNHLSGGKKKSVSFLEIYLNTNQEFLFRDKIHFKSWLFYWKEILFSILSRHGISAFEFERSDPTWPSKEMPIILQHFLI